MPTPRAHTPDCCGLTGLRLSGGRMGGNRGSSRNKHTSLAAPAATCLPHVLAMPKQSTRSWAVCDFPSLVYKTTRECSLGLCCGILTGVDIHPSHLRTSLA